MGEVGDPKPNPMPESINDRPATSHEKIFLLSKAPRYFYNAAAVRQAYAPATLPQLTEDYTGQSTKDYAAAGAQDPSDSKRRIIAGMKKRASEHASPRHAGHITHTKLDQTPRGEGRNLRNYEPAPVDVWNVSTAAFREAHFATFPPELAERCLKAGCPAGGTVLDPFGGAGTTALVADRMGLDCTIIELNPEYAEIARSRIARDQGMFANLEVAA